MDGAVKTPLGSMKKETLIIGGGAVLVMGVMYFRSRKHASITASAGASEINPATGYPYGSAEDAAALSHQAAYISGGGGGGGGSTATGGLGTFVSNAQWSQYVQQMLSSGGQVSDPSQLSAALGKYLTGQPVTPAEVSLIQQAIAIGDKPPLAGPTGYPPSINTTPVAVTPTPQALPAVANLAVSAGGGNAHATWSAVPGAQWYTVFWHTKNGSTGGYTNQAASSNVALGPLNVTRGDWVEAMVFPHVDENYAVSRRGPDQTARTIIQ